MNLNRLVFELSFFVKGNSFFFTWSQNSVLLSSSGSIFILWGYLWICRRRERKYIWSPLSMQSISLFQRLFTFFLLDPVFSPLSLSHTHTHHTSHTQTLLCWRFGWEEHSIVRPCKSLVVSDVPAITSFSRVFHEFSEFENSR